MGNTQSEVFIQRLREERVNAGLSQEALAAALSERLDDTIYASALARMESGKRSVKLDEAIEICNVLNVDLATMLVAPSEVERMLQEQRRALISAQEKFETARKEMGRLQLLVGHLEELHGQGVREAELPTVLSSTDEEWK